MCILSCTQTVRGSKAATRRKPSFQRYYHQQGKRNLFSAPNQSKRQAKSRSEIHKTCHPPSRWLLVSPWRSWRSQMQIMMNTSLWIQRQNKPKKSQKDQTNTSRTSLWSAKWSLWSLYRVKRRHFSTSLCLNSNNSSSFSLRRQSLTTQAIFAGRT